MTLGPGVRKAIACSLAGSERLHEDVALLAVDSVFELAFVLGAVKVAFRVPNESVVIELPQLAPTDSNARRAAITAPADPPPTTMKSKVSDTSAPFASLLLAIGIGFRRPFRQMACWAAGGWN
jgi:hypothetical protein